MRTPMLYRWQKKFKATSTIHGHHAAANKLVLGHENHVTIPEKRLPGIHRCDGVRRETILQQGGDFIAVKGNQPKLFEAVLAATPLRRDDDA